MFRSTIYPITSRSNYNLSIEKNENFSIQSFSTEQYRLIPISTHGDIHKPQFKELIIALYSFERNLSPRIAEDYRFRFYLNRLFISNQRFTTNTDKLFHCIMESIMEVNEFIDELKERGKGIYSNPKASYLVEARKTKNLQALKLIAISLLNLYLAFPITPYEKSRSDNYAKLLAENMGLYFFERVIR